MIRRYITQLVIKMCRPVDLRHNKVNIKRNLGMIKRCIPQLMIKMNKPINPKPSKVTIKKSEPTCTED